MALMLCQWLLPLGSRELCKVFKQGSDRVRSVFESNCSGIIA